MHAAAVMAPIRVTINPMKLGIISDTHNHFENLKAALAYLRAVKIDLLVHCGDATSLEVVQALSGFQVVYLFGNGDFLTGAMQETLAGLAPHNFAGLTYTDHLDGVAIAATHGHLEGELDRLVTSGRYDIVIHGHSHRRRDNLVGRTRVINPGALGGLHIETRSFALLDLADRSLRFIKEGMWQAPLPRRMPGPD